MQQFWIYQQFNRRVFLALFFSLLVSRKATAEINTTRCEWCWLGAVSDRSITIKAKLSTELQPGKNYIQVLYSRSSDLTLTNRDVNKVPASLLSDRIATFNLSDLEADTVYHYVIIADGRRYPEEGTLQFKTVKVGQPYDFAIACSACAGGTLGQVLSSGVSNSKVFEAIAQYQYQTHDGNSGLDLFIHMGDLHYRNDLPIIGLKENYLDDYRTNYDLVMEQTRQRDLYQNIPFAYIWDDHDYGFNDADGTYNLKYLASEAYRERVPHYPLVEELDTIAGRGAIYQSFTIGRVRFIMTDSRFHQNPIAIADNLDKTLLGKKQRAWLLQQLLAGKKRQQDLLEGLTIWVNSIPWIAEPESATSSWNRFTQERTAIANFIKENQIDKLLMISGDAHMLALDDGTEGTANSYATGDGGSFPVIQAAALDSRGSFKGGPYNGKKYLVDPAIKNIDGAIPGKGQWGLLRFSDDGSKIEVRVELKRMENTLIQHTFVF